jgi:hypothetical protein
MVTKGVNKHKRKNTIFEKMPCGTNFHLGLFMLAFGITPKVFTPCLGCFMRFGVHCVCLTPRWYEMD